MCASYSALEFITFASFVELMRGKYETDGMGFDCFRKICNSKKATRNSPNSRTHTLTYTQTNDKYSSIFHTLVLVAFFLFNSGAINIVSHFERYGTLCRYIQYTLTHAHGCEIFPILENTWHCCLWVYEVLWLFVWPTRARPAQREEREKERERPWTSQFIR